MQQPPDIDVFNAQVWEIVRQVPYGQVTTYGQIASMIPCPAGVAQADYDKLAPRWVGNAMNAVSGLVGKEEPSIPWHRVINSKGGISMSPEVKAGIEQRRRLRAEGVAFNEKEQVDFRVVGWQGPEISWREDKKLLPPRPMVTEPNKPAEDDKPQQMSLF